MILPLLLEECPLYICCYNENDFDLCLRIRPPFSLQEYIFKALIADS